MDEETRQRLEELETAVHAICSFGQWAHLPDPWLELLNNATRPVNDRVIARNEQVPL